MLRPHQGWIIQQEGNSSLPKALAHFKHLTVSNIFQLLEIPDPAELKT